MMDFENIQIQLVDLPAVTLELGEAWFTNVARNADGLVLMVNLGDDPADQILVILEKLEEAGVWLMRPGPTDEKRMLIAGNKEDLPGASGNLEILEKEFGSVVPIVSLSAKTGKGMEPFKMKLFELLNIMRIYSKLPGKEPDYGQPFVLPKNSSVEDIAGLVHKDFLTKLKFARIWGSGKFGGQMVKKDFILSDGDIVELHM
jgi:hypothetical protein